MQALRLSWGIVWRMIAWGMCLGEILGAVYVTVVFVIGGSWLAPVGFLAGLAFDGLLGFFLGLVDGLVLAAVTHLTFRPRSNEQLYLAFLGAISAFIAGAGALVLEGLNQSWPFDSEIGSIAWIIYVFVPVLIATGAGWWVSRPLAAWVKQQHT